MPIPVANSPVQVERLPDSLSAVDAFHRLQALPYCIFFDSAQSHSQRGRFSYVAADPFEVIRNLGDDTIPSSRLRARLETYSAPHIPELPPFQGGIAGLFGYEWGAGLESVSPASADEFQAPTLCVGLYDVVLAFDHVRRQSWAISQGFPEQDEDARRERATQRLSMLRNWLDSPPKPATSATAPPVAGSELCPQFPTGFGRRITSTYSRRGYEQAVSDVIQYIRAGDVFQVNLSQRLLAPQTVSSPELYVRLRSRNPAPFAGYFDMGDFQILSASPERFLRCDERRVYTHPIKGTRYRSPHVEADLFAADDLLTSEKDRAENTMIVDLLRNDLSRVCHDDSVFVEQLCGLERFEFVQHLVSLIRGELRRDADFVDLLTTCSPGGSITGAPKIRAMEIIAELEPTVRGAYCGSLAFLGFNGQMDSNILIRTVTAGRGWCQVPVGGGIVALSDPRAEYEETCHKARGIVDIL